MAQRIWMRRLARWHIWLGWLVGVPIVMWTVTGLVMVARPIEDVRGDYLRKDLPAATLPVGNPYPIDFPVENPSQYTAMRVAIQGNRLVWLLTTDDGRIERYAADNIDEPLPLLDRSYARELVAKQIIGGERVASVEGFTAEDPPFDLRRPIPSWRVTLDSGARIYVDRQTGEIAAIRTRWWRLFDVMWGLHIMDIEAREDTSHPILILFAALSVIGSVIGCALLFRRRKTQIKAADRAG